jgi:hypothetical protein
VTLLDSLLDAIIRLDGEALIMHAGEKPYVVLNSASMDSFRGPLAWGQVELSSRPLTTDNHFTERQVGETPIAQIEQHGAAQPLHIRCPGRDCRRINPGNSSFVHPAPESLLPFRCPAGTRRVLEVIDAAGLIKHALGDASVVRDVREEAVDAHRIRLELWIRTQSEPMLLRHQLKVAATVHVKTVGPILAKKGVMRGNHLEVSCSCFVSS